VVARCYSDPDIVHYRQVIFQCVATLGIHTLEPPGSVLLGRRFVLLFWFVYQIGINPNQTIGIFSTVKADPIQSRPRKMHSGKR
jgi:hypothetical protein